MFEFRTTRSGSTYSNYYTVSDPTFDLDDLLRNAADDVAQHEEEPTGAEADNNWVDELDSSPLSSPPPSNPTSRAPSPSPARSHAGPSSSNHIQPRPSIVGKKRGKKERSRIYRAKKRAREREQWTAPAQNARVRRGAQRVANADEQPVDVVWEEMPVTSTGYAGKRGEGESCRYSLDDLIGPHAKVPGMKYMAWDGRCVAPPGRMDAGTD